LSSNFEGVVDTLNYPKGYLNTRMLEQELKLHVPATARPGVERELARGALARTRLRALYFDTPTRALARAKISLRLRLEGRRWVQTLKMPGQDSLSRIELNRARPGPILDLSAYAGLPAGAVLQSLTEPLDVRYETNVLRLSRILRDKGGRVEVAYDSGVIRAGALELPISEIEFELLSGPLETMFTLGKRWQQKFGLIVDARSKAERGDQLTRLNKTLSALDALKADDSEAKRIDAINAFWAPRPITPIMLSAQDNAEQALRAVSAECLDQIIRNSALIAGVDTKDRYPHAHSEHVHQLRVGIRRMRSAWSFFNGLATLPSLDTRLEIKAYFAQLGGARDDDVLRELILPILRKAGQPPLVLDQAVEEADAAATVRGVGFQSWLLDMLASVVLPSKPVTVDALTPASEARTLQAEETLEATLSKKLKKWDRKVVAEGINLPALDMEARHELRKRGKKLRYALQFFESILPQRRLGVYKKSLARVQNILGEMNDLIVARERFVGLRDTQPSAWFACGWITSRLDALTIEATQAFSELSQTHRPWH
jgi:inorganic triphosphatase YgiF